jgi:hypothetical protein
MVYISSDRKILPDCSALLMVLLQYFGLSWFGLYFDLSKVSNLKIYQLNENLSKIKVGRVYSNFYFKRK